MAASHFSQKLVAHFVILQFLDPVYTMSVAWQWNMRLCMGLEHISVSKANNAEMRGLGHICVSHAKYTFVANKKYMNENKQVDATAINK